MSIEGLLFEINFEIKRLIAINTKPQFFKEDEGSKVNAKLKTMESLCSAISNRATELNATLGFFEKRPLKKDLKKLLKVLKDTKSDDEIKISEGTFLLKKFCSKYKADIVEEKDGKIDEEVATKGVTASEVQEVSEEEFNPGLTDRIADAFNKTREKRAKNGIAVDNPVTTFSLDELYETAERNSRIEDAIRRKHERAQEEAERNARINAIFERKRAEQRSRSIDSQEEEQYESAMARKIRELRESLDDELGIQAETMSIRYELQNDTYYVDGEPVLEKPKRLVTAQEKEEYIKSKLKNKSEFGYIIDKYNKEDREALKNCDAYIIGILISKDIRLARDYIKQMTGRKYKKESLVELSVIYDVRGLESSERSNIPSKERRSIRKTARKSRGSAKVLEDKKKLPWYATIPFVGALAVAGIAGITGSFNNGTQNNDKETSTNSYSDTVEPGTTENEIAHTTTANAYTTDYEFSAETTTETTYTTTTTTMDTYEGIEEEPSQTETEINDENNNTDIDVEDNQIEEKNKINIGDKIKVQDGLKYTANCLGGGNSNRIGAVSWRPAAEYNIDKVAFVYQGKVLKIMNSGSQDVEQTLKDVAKQNGIDAEDISTSVLLSLVPGIADTGWANISIDEMQENISKPVEQESNLVSHVNLDFDR